MVGDGSSALQFELGFIGEHEGHILVIQKALCGLKWSGLFWHERFADVPRGMGFFPSKAENDIWMCDMGYHWE